MYIPTCTQISILKRQKAEELKVASANFAQCNEKLNNVENVKCADRWKELNEEAVAKLQVGD